MISQWIQIRRDLHQIPELGFQEFKTQRYLLNYLGQLPQTHLEIRTWKTGILVKVRGSKPRRTIAYRTDIDGLPISERTGLPFQSRHEGNMHACGHDMHMAVALGLVTHFAYHPVCDDLLFVFQPAEEGPGGAKPLLESEIFQSWRPDLMIALHIAPEYPVGTIATKEGILFANTSELFIDFTGKGGHAAYPHQANDMIVAACHFVTQVQSVISRNIDPLDSAVITIGKITAGERQNIIAEHVRLEGTIRTFSHQAMAQIKGRIEALLSGIESGFACQTSVDYGSNYHQVYNHEAPTRQFMEWVNKRTDVRLVECNAAMTGEDFGFFLQEIPGFMFWLGVDSPYGLHHSKLTPKEEAIDVAVTLLTDYLTWQGNEES
jgi:N-acetyldiaminopimelate deacetylase